MIDPRLLIEADLDMRVCYKPQPPPVVFKDLGPVIKFFGYLVSYNAVSLNLTLDTGESVNAAPEECYAEHLSDYHRRTK